MLFDYGMQQLQNIWLHSKVILILSVSIVFSPDGSLVATSSYDETIRLWNTRTLKHKATLIGHIDEISSIKFSPDGKTLATGSYDKIIRLWNTKNWKTQDDIGWTQRGNNFCCVFLQMG